VRIAGAPSSTTNTLFWIAFVRPKNAFNTKKARFKKQKIKKSSHLVKKIKSAFKGPKNLKIVQKKKKFGKSLKIKLMPKNSF
jgi:hypothetical protein